MKGIMLVFLLCGAVAAPAQRVVGNYRQMVADTLESDMFVMKMTPGVKDTSDWVIITKTINYRTAMSGEIVIRWSRPITGMGEQAARQMLALQRRALKDEETDLLEKLARNRARQRASN